MPYEVAIPKALQLVAKGSITVSTTAVGIPADELRKAKGDQIELVLGVETDQIRISPNTVAATTTDMLFDNGDKIRLAGPEICRAMTMIRVTADATVAWWLFSNAI